MSSALRFAKQPTAKQIDKEQELRMNKVEQIKQARQLKMNKHCHKKGFSFERGDRSQEILLEDIPAPDRYETIPEWIKPSYNIKFN